MRRNAREAVYKILFADLFNKPHNQEFKSDTFKECELTEKDQQFAEQLLSTIDQNAEQISGIINDFAKGYEIERIFSTDKCALMIAVCELKYFDDIPNITSIDEALWLVRKYSTEKSLSFVNGILAKLVQGVQE